MAKLVDLYRRAHDYLRISVTDRCNLRCRYCMGPDGIRQIPHAEILTYEEILQLVRAAAGLGIRKVRITGGEPLVRKGLVGLIGQVAAVPGIEDLAMTTNGLLLPKYAANLKEAGLKRVNISLDSLDPVRYRAITRTGELKQVLSGIEAALQLGLHPVKLNIVLMKGFNDGEVVDFLKLSLAKPLHVRFIEYMPIGGHDEDYRQHYLPLTFVQEAAAGAGLPLSPVPSLEGAGPADWYTLPRGKGTVGLIHPISRHFCSSCNRLRLTAEGKLKACLYWQDEYLLRPALGSQAALKKLLREVVRAKPRQHQMSPDNNEGPVKPGAMRAMSKTGG